MEVQNMYTEKFHFSISSVSDAAIYLCKRTMQNKTRLDLADYEAVSADCYVFVLICASTLVGLNTVQRLHLHVRVWM